MSVSVRGTRPSAAHAHYEQDTDQYWAQVKESGQDIKVVWRRMLFTVVSCLITGLLFVLLGAVYFKGALEFKLTSLPLVLCALGLLGGTMLLIGGGLILHFLWTRRQRVPHVCPVPPPQPSHDFLAPPRSLHGAPPAYAEAAGVLPTAGNTHVITPPGYMEKPPEYA